MAAGLERNPVRLAINAWFLDQPGTGSGQYLANLLREFSTLAPDHEFLLVMPADQSTSPIPGLKAEVRSFPSPRWRTNLGKVLFEQIAFPRACRQWGAGLAHVPYWGSPLIPTVPTVVTVHDLIPLLLPAYRGGPLVRLYTRLVAASARRAAAVLTDSLASRRDIEEHLGLPSDRVRCIYLAAGDHFSAEPTPRDAEIREIYGLPQRYVLYLAGHDERKNVEGIVLAFSTVAAADDDVSLVVGGKLPQLASGGSLLRGPSPLYDPRPLVAELGLEDDVHFIGWVDEAHKPALYRGAACALFPSHYEGFGLPVLEALACGTPLVTSNTSSLPELVGDAAFVLDPDDVDALAGAILSCLVDEPLAAELRRRGPKQAARFSWNKTARDTLAAYEAVASWRSLGEASTCES
jgi:glycosyltransferase involved in cell wall biosynthesis